MTGAGRVLGRKAAKTQLDMGEFELMMKKSGVVARVEEETLDECPLAYKSIFEVMELQRNLVTVEAHVKPIINIKG